MSYQRVVRRKSKVDFEALWRAREERYQRFLERAKSRPNKVCYGLSSYDRERSLKNLNNATIRETKDEKAI